MRTSTQHTALELTRSYSGTRSKQVLAADLELAAAAGKNHPDTAHILPIMGHVLGDALTKTGTYIAGVIGKFSVTGARATKYVAAGIAGIIGDGSTTAKAAVLAVLDGDSAVTTADAAFGVEVFNSNAASKFGFGLDLQRAAHDGYNAAAYSSAAIRLTDDVVLLVGTAAPTNGVTGAGVAGPGSLHLCTADGKLRSNTNTKASPTWAIVGSQS